MRLQICASCDRHVTSGSDCPFCGAKASGATLLHRSAWALAMTLPLLTASACYGPPASGNHGADKPDSEKAEGEKADGGKADGEKADGEEADGGNEAATAPDIDMTPPAPAYGGPDMFDPPPEPPKPPVPEDTTPPVPEGEDVQKPEGNGDRVDEPEKPRPQLRYGAPPRPQKPRD